MLNRSELTPLLSPTLVDENWGGGTSMLMQRHMTRKLGGFTLLELMITVAVIAILARIAIPVYRDYVTRGYLVAGTNGLLTARTTMEQYYQDNRTYQNSGATACGATMPTAQNFTLSCTASSSTAYTVTATGTSNAINFVYTIDQNGNQQTTGMQSGWAGQALPASCWLTKRSQTC